MRNCVAWAGKRKKLRKFGGLRRFGNWGQAWRMSCSKLGGKVEAGPKAKVGRGEKNGEGPRSIDHGRKGVRRGEDGFRTSKLKWKGPGRRIGQG